MLTGQAATRLARALFLAAILGAAAWLLAGPPEWRAAWPGGDLDLHAMAFYGLALLASLAFPDRRRADLAAALAVFGLIGALAQGLIGRDAPVTDALAEAAGVCASLLPGLVERARKHCREAPGAPLAALWRRDEKRARPARPPAKPLAGPSPIASLIEADRRARLAARI